MRRIIGKLKKFIRTRSSLVIVIIAAVLIEMTSAGLYWYAHKVIHEEVEHRAKSELQVKNLEIKNVMTTVEVAVKNLKWMVEKNLTQPDSLYGILHRLVVQNEAIVGCGIGFKPNYYQQKGRWFEPYLALRENGRTEAMQIGSLQHDYLNAAWYKETMSSGEACWTEPYYDDAGAQMMLSTYTVPIHDAQGKTVAVLGADVSLDWLSNTINAQHIYPSSFNLIISREGKIMACPEETLVMKRNINEVTGKMGDTTMNRLNYQMMTGMSGKATVTDDKGEKNYVFFAPVGGDTGWSMAVVCADREIFYGLRQVRFNLGLLILLGLALLSLIIYRAARSARRMQDINAEKERIGSELRIASGIQMGMLPKTFPPYPDRDDVEIFGSLVPAKEVGGDLYDFYIRDEKLFFCIGDVSGKGVPASLVMAVTRSLFRTVSAHEALPDRIVSAMNDSMADMNEANMFVTLFIGVLDLPTGRMRYCNAGHCPPLLIGAGVGQLPVEANIPVGLMNGWKYTGQEVLILPQTTIFLYTDGLTEAEDGSHALFGEHRMREIALKMLAENKQNPENLIPGMTVGVHAFVNDAEQSDDLTMLALQYTKKQRDVRLQRSIVLSNNVQEIPKLAAFVDEVCESLDFDMSTTMQMNLALEEAVANVINYAYPAGTKGSINIEAQANDIRLKFVVSDRGMPFDPTTKEEVDTTLSVEERPIGGLGIHLVRSIMDSINYERIEDDPSSSGKGGWNILTLRKKLTGKTDASHEDNPSRT